MSDSIEGSKCIKGRNEERPSIAHVRRVHHIVHCKCLVLADRLASHEGEQRLGRVAFWGPCASWAASGHLLHAAGLDTYMDQC